MISKIVSARLPAREADQLAADAAYLGISRTDALRRALRLLRREVDAERAGAEIATYHAANGGVAPDPAPLRLVLHADEHPSRPLTAPAARGAAGGGGSVVHGRGRVVAEDAEVLRRLADL